MRFLKQNTAIRLTVGPFLDKTDGITPEVALTATNEHITLMVDTGDVPTLVLDANATASGGSNDMVHVTNDDAGFYDLELTAANLNYVGRAMLSINYVTDHCPVFHEFQILPANVYDSLMGTDLLDTSTVQWTGTNVATPDTAGYVKATIKDGTGTGELDTASGKVSLVDGSITTATFAAGAINAAAIATDAIGAAELAADAVTEIQSGLSTLTQANVRTAVGLASANLDTQLAALQADTDNIQTRIPAALVSGRMDSSVGAMATDVLTAAALAADAVAEVVTGLLTTQMTEAYNADNVAPTLAQALFLILGNVSEYAISGVTLTVKKLDGSTTAATYTLDSATTPTSRTRAT